MIAVGGLAFGAIRGTDRNWQDPIAWISLAIGAIALIAFPFLMARRPNPLVPLGLFRRRHFATINLSTLLIYGALYTVLYIQGLFLQGVVGYTATAAGLIGVPTGIMLTLLSARIGTLAGRHGARRVPRRRADHHGARPAVARARSRPTRRPGSSRSPTRRPTCRRRRRSSTSCPMILLFGFGLSLVVAPLTSTLMSSVPVGNAGLASAINNSISRVGTAAAWRR